MNKKSLSERDICTKFNTPAIKNADWNVNKQVLEGVSFTDGKIICPMEIGESWGKKKG